MDLGEGGEKTGLREMGGGGGDYIIQVTKTLKTYKGWNPKNATGLPCPACISQPCPGYDPGYNCNVEHLCCVKIQREIGPI